MDPALQAFSLAVHFLASRNMRLDCLHLAVLVEVEVCVLMGCGPPCGVLAYHVECSPTHPLPPASARPAFLLL